MIIVIITAVVALILGGLCGFLIFRYVIKGKYNEMVKAAKKEAEVIKEKKLLEVKEKFLNKKSEFGEGGAAAQPAYPAEREPSEAA